jgi:Alpha/beta hydrolase family
VVVVNECREPCRFCNDEKMSHTQLNISNLEKWKKAANLPFGAETIYRLSLLSPYTWWRISVLRKHRVLFLPSIIEGMTVVSVSSLGLWMSSFRRIKHIEKCGHATLTSSLSTVKTYVLCSLSAAIVVRVGHFFSDVVADLIKQYKQRSQATDIAWKCLSDLIVLGRAYRTIWYDVYLPCAKADAHKLQFETAIPILFLPGATVEHSSYAGIGRLLAEYGYVVVVMSLEPMRVADGFLSGSNLSLLFTAMKNISSKHYASSELQTEHWVLMGHSMGSLAATKLVSSLGIRRLIMIGSAPFVDFMEDISRSDVKVQVIQGSKDMVIESFGNAALVDAYWKNLPSEAKTFCHVIEGGTHSGFANYVSCWKSEVKGISVHDQQIETVKIANTFIRDG